MTVCRLLGGDPLAIELAAASLGRRPGRAADLLARHRRSPPPDRPLPAPRTRASDQVDLGPGLQAGSSAAKRSAAAG